MDWDKLKIFHAVAEAGNFTKATYILNLLLDSGLTSKPCPNPAVYPLVATDPFTIPKPASSLTLTIVLFFPSCMIFNYIILYSIVNYGKNYYRF